MSRSWAKLSAAPRSCAGGGCSNDSSTWPAFTFERRPCGLSTWNDAGERSSTVPAFSSPSSSYRRCTRELEDVREMLREALQAVITAGNDDLLGARIALDRPAVVEHFVAGFHDEEIALRREARQVQRLPLAQVGFGQLVWRAGVQVLLRAEVSAQAHVRIDRRINEHRPQIVL